MLYFALALLIAIAAGIGVLVGSAARVDSPAKPAA